MRQTSRVSLFRAPRYPEQPSAVPGEKDRCAVSRLAVQRAGLGPVGLPQRFSGFPARVWSKLGPVLRPLCWLCWLVGVSSAFAQTATPPASAPAPSEPAASPTQSESAALPGKSDTAATPGQNTAPLFATPTQKSKPVSAHALALRARWVTVPNWSLSTFLAANTQLNDGWSVGMEYLYRRSGFDVVLSLDYSWIEATSGNYLGKGNNPATETHFVRFDKLSSLSLDVALVGHWNLTSWLEFRLGAGLGLGYVFGNLYQITANSNCTAETAGDTTKCYPTNVGPISQTDAATIDRLDRAGCANDDSTLDTPKNPCQRSTQTYPFNARIVPVLNTTFGFRFKFHDHVYWHLDAGWRLVGFYVGGGPEFRF